MLRYWASRFIEYKDLKDKDLSDLSWGINVDYASSSDALTRSEPMEKPIE